MTTLDNIIICHGSLNKFVMIDETEKSIDITYDDRNLLSKHLCDKDMFDADGVLYVQKETKDDCIGKMSMFNADGGEAEMCGNGIRCVARFISEKYSVEDFFIETKNDKIKIKKEDCIYKDIPTFDALIQPVSLDISTLPMIYPQKDFINSKIENSEISEFSAISVQNPHIVFIKDEIKMEEVISYEKEINSNSKLFPNQVNLNFVQVLNNNSIFVVTNERGSGITPSCGTGMSSSTYITCLLEHCKFNENINVYNNGGKVICRADNINKNIHLIGNASYVENYSIEYDENMKLFNKKLNFEYEDEIKLYDEFLKESKTKRS